MPSRAELETAGFAIATYPFNTIGAEINNLLSLTVDAIAAADVLGSSTPATTTAYIQDSDVSSAAALTVQATSQEQITSTLGNDATADAVAFANASGTTSTATLTSNQIHAAVTAYVDNDNSSGLLPVDWSIRKRCCNLSADENADWYSYQRRRLSRTQ